MGNMFIKFSYRYIRQEGFRNPVNMFLRGRKLYEIYDHSLSNDFIKISTMFDWVRIMFLDWRHTRRPTATPLRTTLLVFKRIIAMMSAFL